MSLYFADRNIDVIKPFVDFIVDKKPHFVSALSNIDLLNLEMPK